jgi:hypothetical protein
MSKRKHKKHNKQAEKQSKRSYRIPLLIAAVLIPVAAVAGWFVLGGAAKDTPTIPGKLSNVQAPAQSTPQVVDKPKADAPAGGPRIEFPEPSYDFGSVADGAKVSHTFAVRNTGNEPLKLIKAAGG